MSECPLGYFGDTAARRCRRCHKGCETCLGRSPTQCLSCRRGFYHYQETNTCVTLCPAGLYADESKWTLPRRQNEGIVHLPTPPVPLGCAPLFWEDLLGPWLPVLSWSCLGLFTRPGAGSGQPQHLAAAACCMFCQRTVEVSPAHLNLLC